MIVHPVETKLDDTLPIRIHLIDAELDTSFMQKRANVLRETQPEYGHILLSKNNIVVGVNTSKIRDYTANSVSSLFIIPSKRRRLKDNIFSLIVFFFFLIFSVYLQNAYMYIYIIFHIYCIYN